ncbi:hypothetical protein E4U32_006565 [Claviceps aff. humidiphila group G2b]|nr:hypothetical protein E4U32_006565 [Claviceps aff. humidiphila group G2b]
MAIELLKGEEHSFLHDLESFFWVLFWICIHYGKSGKDSRRLPRYHKWNYSDDFTLAYSKQNVLYSALDFIAVAERDFMPYYKPLIPYMSRLRALLPYVVQLPGKAFLDTVVPENPGVELYSQIIEVLREAQKDPEVQAE